MVDDVEGALSLARQELSERLRRQLEEAKVLDTKAQVLLAFSITALTAVLTGPLHPVPRALSFVAFIPTLCFGAAALVLYPYRDPVDPDALVRRHMLKGYLPLLAETIRAHADAIEHNDQVHKDRAKKWKAALWSLAAAVTFGVIGFATEGLVGNG